VNVVEIVRGIGNILIVMIVAGAVAYVGDRVGHQVGRKRLSLFGIRPRYTSTIVAIGTGMVIALILTLGAIFASQEVKTAFFRLSAINQQIQELQSREQELSGKVNYGRLVVPNDALMVPVPGLLRSSATPGERLAAIRQYYDRVVTYINTYYPRLGLRPYKSPPDIDKTLATLAQEVATQASLSPDDQLLTVTADQNLFVNDPIHFQITATIDDRKFVKGQLIRQLPIAGNSGASVTIEAQQLENAVEDAAVHTGMPDYLAKNVQVFGVLPEAAQMQQTINKPGTYLLSAFASQDVYPHTGGVPIVIVLSQYAAK
jgi:hypothetical protein